MLKLSQLKKLRQNTNKIAYVGAVMSVLATYAALSGTKYPTRVFCFKPEVIHNQNAERNQNYCKSGDTVWQTHPRFLLSRDVDVPNPSFVFGNDQYLIPAKGRVDKRLNEPDNPNYIWYALMACGMSTLSYSLYSSSLKRYSFDFPKYYEQVKNFTFSEQLDGRQTRTVKKVQNELDTKYIVDKQTREHQIMQALEMSENEIKDLYKSSDKQSELSDYQYQLQLSEIARLKAENELATAKSLKEKEKIENKKIDSKNSNNVQDVNQVRKSLMIEKLKEHEDGWIFKLLDIMKPIWIIGDQGGGKSTFASCLVLLRYFVNDWDLYQIIDAHAQKNLKKSWLPLVDIFGDNLKVIGANNDYPSIAQAFEDSIDRWAKRDENDKPIQTLVDEFSNLSDADDCKNEAGRFAKHSLSDPRKAAEYCIFLAHYFTGTATGNKTGTNKAREKQTVQIHRKSANGKFPLPNVRVNGIPDENGNVEEFEATIPDWMQPDKIMKFFKDGKDIFEPDEIDQDKLEALDPWCDKNKLDSLGF